MKTEIVYVCSPDFWPYLFLSLRTLFASETEIDKVRIYVVAEKEPEWNLDDSRIVVEPVPDIGAEGEWGYYWGNNKLHLCKSDAERVVYLDADTMVLGPINNVYENTEKDLIARYGVSTYMEEYHDPKRWQKVLAEAGAEEYPKYSPGFMIFQNNSHKEIEKEWNLNIRRILKGELSLPVNKHAELYAFSIAASKSGLTHHAMEDSDHRYAMLGEPHTDATVYHLGTPRFYEHYLSVESEIGIQSRSDLPVRRPRFVKLRDLYTRGLHRLKSKILGHRDSRLEY